MKAPSPTLASGTRLQALDILRGLVIVIMVLDHVRDYLHDSGYAYDPLDPKFTTPIVYLTRWISNFCAPTFIFLAGVSIWLQSIKGKDTPRLSRFLFVRGLWIIFLEATVMSFGWAFSIPYLVFFQVMWAIGCSMIALSVFVRLPQRAVLFIGITIVAGHNLLDPIVPKDLGAFAPLWLLLHEGGFLYSGANPAVAATYPILPWIGVMSLGYGLGPVFLSPHRDRILIRLGAAMITGFLILRTLNIYGDPNPYNNAMTFFNVQKYPPSLLYVCSTLGPVFLLYPLLDRAKGPVIEFFRTFGSVPMIAYIIHLYTAHAVAVAIHFAAGHNLDGMFNSIYDAYFRLEAYAGTGFPLYVTYLAWLVVLALIYPFCRCWAGLKRRRRDWWLSYL